MIVYTDGGSRGNPGPSACAAYFPETGIKASSYLGIQTNNFAEYQGLLVALSAAIENMIGDLTVRSDSQLMVCQINGSYAVKSATIAPLHKKATELIGQLSSFQIEYVPRAQNTVADREVNNVLDTYLSA